MDRSRQSMKPDARLVAAAAIAAMIAVEVESVSRITLDAMRTSTAIAVRVVSPPGHVKATVGVSLGLATAALCLFLLSRVANASIMSARPPSALARQSLHPPTAWRSRLIRSARSGGARDR